MSMWTPGPGEYSLVIGDIGITPAGEVVTPAGTFPLHGSRWTVYDMSTTRQEIPTYAIVLAIVLALACLLGLLFLLIREERTDGWVQVTVSSSHGQHTTQIPVASRFQVQQIYASVASAQSMARQF